MYVQSIQCGAPCSFVVYVAPTWLKQETFDALKRYAMEAA